MLFAPVKQETDRTEQSAMITMIIWQTPLLQLVSFLSRLAAVLHSAGSTCFELYMNYHNISVSEIVFVKTKSRSSTAVRLASAPELATNTW